MNSQTEASNLNSEPCNNSKRESEKSCTPIDSKLSYHKIKKSAYYQKLTKRRAWTKTED